MLSRFFKKVFKRESPEEASVPQNIDLKKGNQSFHLQELVTTGNIK